MLIIFHWSIIYCWRTHMQSRRSKFVRCVKWQKMKYSAHTLKKTTLHVSCIQFIWSSLNSMVKHRRKLCFGKACCNVRHRQHEDKVVPHSSNGQILLSVMLLLLAQPLFPHCLLGIPASQQHWICVSYFKAFSSTQHVSQVAVSLSLWRANCM